MEAHMRREYNSKISEKANTSLNRRYAIVKIQKAIIAAIIIIAISIIVLLNSSIHAFADSKDNLPVHKYYTSIRVEEGDTLWSIADEYSDKSNMTKTEYIKEICSINNISEEIHSGENIIVSYYSTDIQ